MAASLEERVDREVRFTSDVSHELRSPLAALRASLEVIDRRREGLPEAVDSAFEIIQTRVASFEALVLDLLEISRFDANAVTLDREPINVGTFLHHLLLANDAEHVAVHVPDAPLEIAVDRRRLAQGLSNIITNADRYAGGVTDLTVTTPIRLSRSSLTTPGPGSTPANATPSSDGSPTARKADGEAPAAAPASASPSPEPTSNCTTGPSRSPTHPPAVPGSSSPSLTGRDHERSPHHRGHRGHHRAHRRLLDRRKWHDATDRRPRRSPLTSSITTRPPSSPRPADTRLRRVPAR